MGELAALTVAWAVVSLSGVMSPGPISALSLGEGATCGTRAGPLISTGHALTEAVMVAALGIGLSGVLQHRLIAGIIGVVGGAFLLWMGYDLVVKGRHRRLRLAAAEDPPQRAARPGLLSAGALLSVLNPYWLLWWATVGSATLLKFLPYGLVGLAVFYLSHVSLDYGWNTFLAAVGSSGRRVMPERVYRGLLMACGLFLVLMGGYFIWSGIGFLSSGGELALG